MVDDVPKKVYYASTKFKYQIEFQKCLEQNLVHLIQNHL